MVGLIPLFFSCSSGLEAALTLSPDHARETAVLQDAAEVRILRGGMDVTLDEPDEIDAFINALSVEMAVYDATYPTCMPALWISFSSEERQPLASVVFCEATGSGVVEFSGLGARTVSPERAAQLRKMATARVVPEAVGAFDG